MNPCMSPQRRRYSNENQAAATPNSRTSAIMTDAGDDHHECHDDYHEMASTSNSSVVDTIVNAAQVCNSLVSEYCGLCTFYIDKQVQYELISSAAREPVVMQMPTSTEEYFAGRRKAARDVARQLFDEESVVESVTSR